MWTALAATAAGLTAILAWNWDGWNAGVFGPTNQSTIASNVNSSPRQGSGTGEASSVDLATEDRLVASDRDVDATTKNRVVQLPIASLPNHADVPASTPPLRQPPSPATAAVAGPLTVAADKIADALNQQWIAAGLTPTKSVSDDQWRQRIGDLFSVKLPKSVVDADSLHRWIGRPSNAKSAARIWLSHTGLSTDEAAIDAAAELFFAGETSADHKVAGWIKNRSHPTHRDNDVTAVASLVSLTLDTDARCVACHDEKRSFVTAPQQSDFWSIVALMAPSKQKTFYESLDARTHMAMPGIASAMIDGVARVGDRGQWADQIVGTNAVARGLARSLVNLIPGRNSFSNPSPSLQSLVQSVSDDLSASNFDMGRALALVMSAPPMHRSEVSRQISGRSISVADIERHVDSLAAFGSSPVSWNQRLAHHQRSTGQTLSNFDGTLLGQIEQQELGSDSSPGGPMTSSRVWNYPELDNEFFQDQTTDWLVLIDDADAQREHLAMLDGDDRLPRRVVAQDQWMRQSGHGDRLRVRRLRWLLQ